MNEYTLSFFHTPTYKCIGLLCSLSLGVHCHPSTSAPPVEQAATLAWHTVVKVDATLRSLAIETCYEGPPPKRIGPQTGGLNYLQYATWEGQNELVQEDPKAGVLLLQSRQPGCLQYGIDLARMTNEQRSREILQVGNSILLSPHTFLFQPEQIPPATTTTLRFEIPKPLRASAPWQTINPSNADDLWQLDSTAYRWLTRLAIGQLEIDRFTALGANFELVQLDRQMQATKAGLRQWIRQTAQAIAPLYHGRFPVDHVQIVVHPVSGGHGTHFGLVGRGGGFSIYFRVSDSVDDENLRVNWTTIHEFLHLGMPFVEDSWMAEGFVSYYTEILLTRAGYRSEAEGWSQLMAGFERGQKANPELTIQEASDGMFVTAGPYRVYWGGAVLAFLLDLHLRRETKGKLSFDDVMRELHRCCQRPLRLWSAEEILAHLDAWYGTPVFTRMAKKYLHTTTFPPIEQAMQSLGIEVSQGRAVLHEEHPQAKLRASIMRFTAE